MCEIYTNKCTCSNCPDGCSTSINTTNDIENIIEKIFKKCDDYRATLNLPPHDPNKVYCDDQLCFDTCLFNKCKI